MKNAALGESTLTNAKLRLISLAESRMADDIEGSVNITQSLFKQLVHSVNVVSSALASLKVFKDDSRSDLKGKIFEARKLLSPMLDKIEEVKQFIEKKSTPRDELSRMLIGTRASRCELRLDDAVSVIRSLSQTTPQAEQQSSRSKIESLVNQKVQKALFYFKSIRADGSSSKSPNGSSYSSGTVKGGFSNPSISKKRNKGKEKKASGGAGKADKSLVCFDCGNDDQKRGDDECPRPSYLSKKRKEETKDRRSGADVDGHSGPSPFRPGSDATN